MQSDEGCNSKAFQVVQHNTFVLSVLKALSAPSSNSVFKLHPQIPYSNPVFKALLVTKAPTMSVWTFQAYTPVYGRLHRLYEDDKLVQLVDEAQARHTSSLGGC